MYASLPTLILNLPILLTLIAATRYIIGLKTWRNYPVLALSIAFYLLYSITDSIGLALLFWTIFYILIIGSATISKYLIRRIKTNYYSKIAIIYFSAMVTSYIALLLINQTPYFTYSTDIFMGLAVFIIGTTIDDIATLMFKKDTQEYIRRMVTTTALGLTGGLILSWPWWNSILSRYPAILVFVLVIDIITAFWSTLRITEYFRFGSIIKDQK